jgi:putative ABC transport system ATP-binding protein
VIIITHNIGIAAMAHRVIHFSDGRIARIEVNDHPVDPGTISW